tara:strand:+ start:428 stop:802 length:375 start_codon:yes stop_codon:yes gene_type:complete
MLRIDHIVLTVDDIQETIDFYTHIFKMEAITFGDNRRALRFGEQKINLHQRGKEFLPCASRPTPGSIDICFISDESIDIFEERIKMMGLEIEEGPVKRSGAVGEILSIYFRDPSGNLIEISNYL